MTAQWKKFDGSKDQFEEMSNASHGWIFRFHDGQETEIEKGKPHFKLEYESKAIKEYLICQPIPHADMIARHAKTGQPVYYNTTFNNQWGEASPPSWNREIEYSFSLPEDKKYIEVRDYLYEKHDGTIRKGTLHKDNLPPIILLGDDTFLRWLDDDWRKVEV